MWFLVSGLAAYLTGALFGLARQRRASLSFAVLGSLLQAAASVTSLAGAATVTWTLPISSTIFPWTVRMDPLAAWFNLTLAILAVAVTIYSFGYLRLRKPDVLG